MIEPTIRRKRHPGKPGIWIILADGVAIGQCKRMARDWQWMLYSQDEVEVVVKQQRAARIDTAIQQMLDLRAKEQN